MGISNLPSGGENFKASVGPGSFKRKLFSAIQAGNLKHLNNNTEAIMKAVKKYEKAIRFGNFSRYRQIRAMKIIKDDDKNLTVSDKKSIKKILKHLSNPGEKKEIRYKAKAEKEEVDLNQIIGKELTRNKRVKMVKNKLGLNYDRNKGTGLVSSLKDKKSATISRINNRRVNSETGLVERVNNRVSSSALNRNRIKSFLNNKNINNRRTGSMNNPNPPISFR